MINTYEEPSTTRVLVLGFVGALLASVATELGSTP
jgi:hypothetical protein